MSKNKSLPFFLYFSLWLVTGHQVALWPVLAGIEFRFLGGHRQTIYSGVWRCYSARRETYLGLHFLREYDWTCIKQVFVAWATLLVSPSINYTTKGGGGVTTTTVMVFNGFRCRGSVNTKECWGRSPVMLCSHLQPSNVSCQMYGFSYSAPFVLPALFSFQFSLALSIPYSPCVSVALLLHDLYLCFPVLLRLVFIIYLPILFQPQLTRQIDWSIMRICL